MAELGETDSNRKPHEFPIYDGIKLHKFLIPKCQIKIQYSRIGDVLDALLVPPMQFLITASFCRIRVPLTSLTNIFSSWIASKIAYKLQAHIECSTLAVII